MGHVSAPASLTGPGPDRCSGSILGQLSLWSWWSPEAVLPHPSSLKAVATPGSVQMKWPSNKWEVEASSSQLQLVTQEARTEAGTLGDPASGEVCHCDTLTGRSWPALSPGAPWCLVGDSNWPPLSPASRVSGSACSRDRGLWTHRDVRQGPALQCLWEMLRTVTLQLLQNSL